MCFESESHTSLLHTRRTDRQTDTYMRRERECLMYVQYICNTVHVLLPKHKIICNNLSLFVKFSLVCFVKREEERTLHHYPHQNSITLHYFVQHDYKVGTCDTQRRVLNYSGNKHRAHTTYILSCSGCVQSSLCIRT